MGTLAIIGLIATLVSTVGTVVATQQQSKAQKAAADAQADAAEFNAAVIRQEGQTEASRLRRVKGLELSRIRAGAAKAGVTFEGSPVQFFTAQAAELERDAMNAERAAVHESNLLELRAKSSRVAGEIAGDTTAQTIGTVGGFLGGVSGSITQSKIAGEF